MASCQVPCRGCLYQLSEWNCTGVAPLCQKDHSISAICTYCRAQKRGCSQPIGALRLYGVELSAAASAAPVDMDAVKWAQGAVKRHLQAEETRSAREKDKADKEQKQKEKKQAIAEAMLQTTKRQTEVFDALLGAVSSLVEQNNIVHRDALNAAAEENRHEEEAEQQLQLQLQLHIQEQEDNDEEGVEEYRYKEEDKDEDDV